ncbi:metallopeptidase TldD-related protein [Natranaerobius trueperi]|uniref:metallopeptidase TldD-related protein n=1 Tax=Natranaerobius trueperi TaxID=759412 RepID=UPI001F0B6EE4|nr:metallopeptidase TldD-related protein [Natranaerobius trueperi]
MILDSDVRGLFIHEAFGHLSEADNLIGNETLAKIMILGSEFAMEKFNVIDDPTKTGHPGSYVYDHEGTKAKPMYLIENGKLSGRLYSLQY